MTTSVAIVEDEPRVLSLYATWLEEEHEVERVPDGQTALEVIDDQIDVVVLDRRMPGISGDEVLLRLRERGYEGWVVMATAVDPEVDVWEMDFDDYLTKPIERAQLLDAVSMVEARSAYDREIREYFQLMSKLALLENQYTMQELGESDEYARLNTKRLQVEERLDDAIVKLEDRGDYDDLFIELPRDVE